MKCEGFILFYWLLFFWMLMPLVQSWLQTDFAQKSEFLKVTLQYSLRSPNIGILLLRVRKVTLVRRPQIQYWSARLQEIPWLQTGKVGVDYKSLKACATQVGLAQGQLRVPFQKSCRFCKSKCREKLSVVVSHLVTELERLQRCTQWYQGVCDCGEATETRCS